MFSSGTRIGQNQKQKLKTQPFDEEPPAVPHRAIVSRIEAKMKKTVRVTHYLCGEKRAENVHKRKIVVGSKTAARSIPSPYTGPVGRCTSWWKRKTEEEPVAGCGW